MAKKLTPSDVKAALRVVERAATEHGLSATQYLKAKRPKVFTVAFRVTDEELVALKTDAERWKLSLHEAAHRRAFPAKEAAA